jgi:protein CpxP
MSKQFEVINTGAMPTVSQQPPAQRNRRWAMAGIAAMMIGAFSVAGVSYADDTTTPPASAQAPHHGMRHGPMDPATAEKRIDRMVERIVPDASAEQKAKISGIFKAAAKDMRPLREQHRAAHQQAIKILSQPTIDRAALERVRVNQMRLADQMSKRMTQAMTDAAEVLTPAQRAKAAERFRQHMEHRGEMGHHEMDQPR